MVNIDAHAKTFDITARKFHQSVCVLLLAAGFVLGPPAGTLIVALVGVVMLVGRFWWPLDIFRQLVWRVLEPAGVLRRREVQEDHATRRIARVLGGVVFLLSAAALAQGWTWAWIAVAAIGVMISLDAVFDFCALCAVTHRVGRLTARTS